MKRIERTLNKMAKQKLTEELIEIARETMAKGWSKRQLALNLGISPDTVSNWIKKGRESEKDDLYRKFCSAIQAGEAIAEQQLLDRVRAAAEEGIKSTKKRVTKDASGTVTEIVEEETTTAQLKAILWQLEHKYRWGQHVKQEKERVINRVLRIAEKSLQPNQYDTLIQGILKSKLSEELDIDNDLLGGD